MQELAKQDCQIGGPSAERLEDQAEIEALVARLAGLWEVSDQKRLRRAYAFKDFATALAFVNRVGKMADAQDHHPDIQLRWGEVVLEIWTHTANGLSLNDFVFAAKAERLLEA